MNKPHRTKNQLNENAIGESYLGKAAIAHCRKSANSLSRYGAFTGSDRPDLEGGYPFVVSKGKGCNLWSLGGQEFIDFTCATGAVILGYAYPDIVDAVSKRASFGNIFITPYSDEMGILAEQLVDIIPSAEKVAFFRTGSCGTTAAVRLARVFTERDIILTCGYHGWHDWHQGIFPRFKFADDRHIEFGYNLNLLEQLLEKHRGKVAAVIITPEPAFFPDSYFHELSEIVSSYDALLIFDEVMSGFRYQLGGVQARCGVKPDISIFGKGLANEYSLSVVVGRAEIIDARSKTHLAGTFNHEMTPIVAAIKTLDIIKKRNVIETIQDRGRILLDGLEKLFEHYGIISEITDTPAIFHVIFDTEEFAQAFYKKCLEFNLIFNRFDQQMISFSHSPEVIKTAIDTVEEVLRQMYKSHPAAFENWNKELSSSAKKYRTLHEFGGLCNYRLPVDSIPRKWHQDDR